MMNNERYTSNKMRERQNEDLMKRYELKSSRSNRSFITSASKTQPLKNVLKEAKGTSNKKVTNATSPMK